MENVNALRRLLSGMADEELSTVETTIKEVRASKRTIDLNEIRPGMSAERKEEIRAEIARLMQEQAR
jgi:hypothetical protein